jgi:hypothetical protein
MMRELSWEDAGVVEKGGDRRVRLVLSYSGEERRAKRVDTGEYQHRVEQEKQPRGTYNQILQIRQREWIWEVCTVLGKTWEQAR